MRKVEIIDIYILEILEKHASAERRLSQADIITYLDVDYNLTVSRKTLSAYLCMLREAGYIAGNRGVYGIQRFDDHELRLLIDGVLFGQHVPQEDAKVLIDKLKAFSHTSMKNRVKHVCYLEGITRTQNNHLYEIIDTIDEAIERNRKIEITQCAYDVNGRLYDKGTVVVDPYYMVTEKSRYYLICYAGRNDDLENRRIDRMSKVRMLDDSRIPINRFKKYKQGFDLAEYMREHIYMFSGDSSIVHIRIKKSRIGDFIDWFGNDYHIEQKRDDDITVRIRANENAVYYWALQYGATAEVVKPERLRERIKNGLEEMLERYRLGG